MLCEHCGHGSEAGLTLPEQGSEDCCQPFSEPASHLLAVVEIFWAEGLFEIRLFEWDVESLHQDGKEYGWSERANGA